MGSGMFMGLGLVFRATSNLPSVFQRDRKAYRSLANEFQRNSSKVQSSAVGMAASIRQVTALAAAGFLSFTVASTVSASALQQQMQRVSVVTRDAIPDMAGFRRELISISGSTGNSAEAIATIAEQAGTAGIAGQLGAAGMQMFIDTVSKFSGVSGMNLDSAGKLLSEIVKQYKLKGNEIEPFASALQLVGKNSVSGTAEVAKYAKSLVMLKRTTNFSNHEILGIAGSIKAFGDITQELVRTNFPKFFSSAAIHAEKFAKQMGFGTGPTATAALKHLIDTNPYEFLLRFIDGLEKSKMSTSEMSIMLHELGVTSERVQRIFIGAIGQTDEIRQKTRLAKEALMGFTDTLQNDFMETMKALGKQSQRVFINMANIGKQLGFVIIPYVTVGAKLIADMLGLISIIADTFAGKAIFGAAIFGTLKFLAGYFGAIVTDLRTLSGITKINKATMKAFQAGAKSDFFILGGFPALRMGKAIQRFFTMARTGLSGFLTSALSSVATWAPQLTAVFAAAWAFGPTVKQMFQDMADVAVSVFSFTFGKTIKVSRFKRMGERGLLNFVRGAMLLVNSVLGFSKGFLLGFLGIEDTQPIWNFFDKLKKFLMELPYLILDAYNLAIEFVGWIIGKNVDEFKLSGFTSKDAEKFGKLVGAAFRGALVFLEPLFKLAEGLVYIFTKLVELMDSTRKMLNLYKAYKEADTSGLLSQGVDLLLSSTFGKGGPQFMPFTKSDLSDPSKVSVGTVAGRDRETVSRFLNALEMAYDGILKPDSKGVIASEKQRTVIPMSVNLNIGSRRSSEDFNRLLQFSDEAINVQKGGIRMAPPVVNDFKI